MAKSYTVYKHTNPNGKVYIGITCQKPNERWKNGKGYKTQSLFYRSIKKYGWDNFKHEILFADLTKEEAEQKEIELIAHYKSNQNKYGYNIENGGNCSIVGEETKKKISKALKGKPSKLNGRKRDVETKNKISATKKGHVVTEETKQKISSSQKGKPSHLKGKTLSDEHKKKISEYRKGKTITEENKTKLKEATQKKVICLETNVVYESITMASKQTGTNASHIGSVCNGKRKTCGGYRWCYYG